MMDEQLIDEVAQHSVIYNRQKYYLNGSGGNSGGINKFETKDDAWQIIAMRLRSDVETCKKRWKYLRERYVSQRKQGDPPVYEHLSRPYLEKMKFLDQHIQPRKSYRSMPNYLTSPHSANSSFNGDYSMDAKSNGSHKSLNTGHYAANNHHYNHAQQQPDPHAMDSANSHVKIEADQMFRDFAAAVASQQLHQHQVAAVAAAIADSSQNYQEHFRENTGNNGASSLMTTGNHNGGSSGGLASSSSIKSSLSSPLSSSNAAGLDNNIANATTSQQNTAHSSPSSTSCANAATTAAVHSGYAEVNNDDLDSTTGCNYNMKKPRVQLNNNCHNSNNNSSNHMNNNNSMNGNGNNFGVTDTEDDSDDNSNSIMKQQNFNEQHVTNQQSSNNSLNSAAQRANAMNNTNQFSSNAELLFQLYQQLPQQQQSQLSSGAYHHQQQQQQQPPPPHQHYNKFQMPTPQNVPVERSSEQLLGELVTTELLSMPKERRKKVQKRILEILFFDD